MLTANDVRIEKDLLGSVPIPADAYYGIQSYRAMDNFQLSNVTASHYSNLLKALAMVKQGCASANYKVGLLSSKKVAAITGACLDVQQGRLNSQFRIDMLQGGAGTSLNMNANEVIANRALEIMGHERGDYQKLHPNDDVNCSQSTNDVYPSAIKLAVLLNTGSLISELNLLVASLSCKAKSFAHVSKMGRTQLQDAVPMTLGEEFNAFASALRKGKTNISSASTLLYELNLGGTAIGTGLNADPKFGEYAIEYIKQISGYPFRQSVNLVEATSDTAGFVQLSSTFKGLAITLSKISNDLRLLCSGPRTGFNEINLPAVQSGSSIMPGKINPVIPEAINQVAYEVIGNDLSITMASEAAQLQLNAMEPLILFKLLQTSEVLTRAMFTLRTKCIEGITANQQVCQSHVNNSIGIITCLNPYLGYEQTSRIAQQALVTGKGIIDLVAEQGLMDVDEIHALLNSRGTSVREKTAEKPDPVGN